MLGERLIFGLISPVMSILGLLISTSRFGISAFILIFGLFPFKSILGPLIFISTFGISASKFRFGILPSIFILGFGISTSNWGIWPFTSTFGIFGLISISGILPSTLGILPFISTDGIFPSKEALGIFIFFLFKLISGELTSISGELILISLLRFISLSIFISNPGFFNSIFGFSIFGPLIFPSSFKSVLILGAFIFFFPPIIPEQIKSPLGKSIFKPVFTFGIFPSILISFPLIFAFNSGFSILGPFISIFPDGIFKFGELIWALMPLLPLISIFGFGTSTSIFFEPFIFKFL